MSYDFVLMRLDPTPGPGAITELVQAQAQRPIGNAAPLFDAVRASALFAPGSIAFDDAGRLTWNTPDGGQVGVTAIADVISLKMHAHWAFAAQLFELARTFWPDLVLLDLQRDQVHDPASFRAAIAHVGDDV
jgi:hypothetical protein